MKDRLIFIYDGQCPFCNYFAELIELKSNLSNIEIKNARDNPSYIPKGYDMDLQGAILIKENEMLYGSEAINWICSRIKEPSDSLLKILSVIFSSKKRVDIFFPLLLIARRITLAFMGIPRKLDINLVD